jgi:nicotinate-nucleotide adenylyltransferase
MGAQVGLFFGSFNPVHIGHIIVAQYALNETDLDEVWLVVSPQNPHKKKAGLLDERSRLHLVDLALEPYPGLKSQSIEFSLPRPSYTVLTLAALREKFPDRRFSLLLGADNAVGIESWKDGKRILENHKIWVYPRGDLQAKDLPENGQMEWMDAPRMELSSTYIRSCIREGKNPGAMLPPAVWAYIDHNGLYRRSG